MKGRLCRGNRTKQQSLPGGVDTANLEFSKPYNSDPETLTKIFKLENPGKNSVAEICISRPQAHSSFGRVADEINLSQFIDGVKRYF